MTRIGKKLRYYYWLLASFFQKNIRLLVISFVLSFFIIILFVNSIPYISSLLFRSNERTGLVGRFQLQDTPSDIQALISHPLVSLNERGELTPVLVSSWEIKDSNKTYVFHLKPNLFWSDGAQFTAHDVDLSFDGIKINVIDDTTIEFRLNKPLSTFPIYLTRPIIKHPLKGVAGLYRVQSYKLSRQKYLQTINLVPNRSKLAYKTYRFYDSEESLISGYKKGEVTTIQTSKKSLADTFSSWKNTKITRSINYNQMITLFFNAQSPFFQERDVRKAFAYATPHFDDLGVPATGPISPLSWAYESDVKSYPQDLEKAQSLYKKNSSASESAQLNLYTFYDYISVAEKLKSNYQKLGVKINLRVLSYLPQDFDMLLTAWSPPADPDQYYFWHSTQKEDNITRYKNVKVDKLLEDGRKITNIAERKKIYKEFQEHLVDDLPAYFIYYPYVYTIMRK